MRNAIERNHLSYKHYCRQEMFIVSAKCCKNGHDTGFISVVDMFNGWFSHIFTYPRSTQVSFLTVQFLSCGPLVFL